MIATLLVGVALADKPVKLKPADCEPLDESSFRALVLDAQAAMDRDDAALNAQILGEIDARIPCLTFAPTPRVWADLLVSESIAAFAAQGDWQTPLAAAVRVRPQIDRGVGPAHPIGRWEPPAGDAPVSAGPLPAGVELWVDGSLATELPPTAGLHLVQRVSDGQWISRITKDEAIPSDWLTGVIVHPLAVIVDGEIGGGYELLGAVQTRNVGWESDYLARGNSADGGPALSGRAMARVRKAVVLGEARGRFLTFEPLELAHATLGLGARVRPRLYAALGLGLYQYPTYVGAECMGQGCAGARPDVHVEWVAAAHLTGMLAWYGRDADAPARGGVTFASRGSTYTTTLWWSKQLEGSWYFGVNGSTFGGQLRQEGSETDVQSRRLNFGGGTIGAELGLRFGLARGL